MQNWSAPTNASSAGAVLPDYAGGSVLNLMSSIALARGEPVLPHAPLRGLDIGRLESARVVVLIVVDGLGLEYLCRQGRGGALWRHLRGAMTSVFPSTTAAAVTTFLTGLAPQQHALTGWHIYFEEVGQILASLPLVARDPEAPDVSPDIPLAPRLFDHEPLFGRMRRKCASVAPEYIVDSDFNAFHCRGAERAGYGSLENLFDTIETLAGQRSGPGYIYAYYPELDSLAHQHGIGSGKAAECLEAFDAAFSRFCQTLAGSDVAVLVTADHGFIDSPPERLVDLEAHPDLARMLSRPLCGEWRVAYCYVPEVRHADFERYVSQRLERSVTLHRSADLIESGWFGPGAAHPRLRSRTGDYTLVARDNWTIKDWMPGEKRYPMIGVHGGTSAREMLVPLVAIGV